MNNKHTVEELESRKRELEKEIESLLVRIETLQKSPNFTVVVKEGLVQDIYCTYRNARCEIIDLDTEDNEEYDTLMGMLETVKKTQHHIY